MTGFLFQLLIVLMNMFYYRHVKINYLSLIYYVYKKKHSFTCTLIMGIDNVITTQSLPKNVGENVNERIYIHVKYAIHTKT